MGSPSMKMIAAILVAFLSCTARAADAGVLEKALVDGMAMISAGKIHDAMNEIRVGINCYGYDPKPVSAESIQSLDTKISQESDKQKKAALLVYKAVILLSHLRDDASAADDGIKLLTAAEEADQNLPEVYNTRGICYLFKRAAAAALKDFEKAVSLNANFLDAINNRGEAHRALGQTDLAVQDKIRYQRMLSKLNYPEKP